MAEAAALGKTIKGKVEEEAAAAEAEEPDAEPAEPAEPDTDADEAEEEEDQPAEPEDKKGGRKPKSDQERFDAAMAYFKGKLKELFQVPDLASSPYPGVAGFLLPGFAEPRTHENYIKCATCNGLGRVLTQANTGKEEFDWHVCPDNRCKGRGYWEKASAVQPLPETGPLAVAPPPQPTGEFQDAPTWMGDPSLTPKVA